MLNKNKQTNKQNSWHKHAGNAGDCEKTNLRVRGLEQREETQVKGTHNIFNKIKAENFPSLMPMENKKHAAHQIDWIRKEVPLSP